jgi:outer membrane protein OmpA-like peptidoglycan-associated protein
MKKILFSALLIASGYCGFSQTYLGYNTGNYTGVNSVFFNPGNIAKSPYKWSVNVIGLNANIANDYASVKLSALTSSGDINADIKRVNNSSSSNFLVNADIFGPSAMFNINAKSAFAVTTRARTVANIDRIPGDLLSSFQNGFNAPTYPTTINTNNFRVTELSWVELGLTYARVLIDKKHFLKGGITLKYLGGVSSGYFNLSANSKLDQDANNNTYLQNGVGQLSYGYAGDISNPQLNFIGNGIGGDAGFVYEYRPDNVLAKNAHNLYKVKVEVAIHDIGKVQFNHGADDAAYSINTNLNPPFDTLRLSRFNNVSNFEDFNTALKNTGSVAIKTSTPQGKYGYTLPGALTGSIDYLVVPKFYVNLGGQVSLNRTSSSVVQKVHTANYVVFTPRYETRHFTVSLPLSDNNISGFNAGISISAGPVFIGSGSVVSSLINGETKQADFHFGLIINGLRKREKRKAPTPAPAAPVTTVAPVAAPVAIVTPIKISDSDGDGVVDSLDKCPTIAGLAKYNGCPIPDSDSDGVNDEADKCPTIAGLAKYNGCPIPDSDSDGVNDEADKCPTIAGLAKYNGCPIPDSDSDGVNDEADKCPTIAGPASNSGCPEVNKALVQKTNKAAQGIQFQTGKAIILTTSYAKLNAVVQVLKTDPTLNIDIAGYTDNSGDPAKNQKLSANRATAVKAYLVKKGISATRITAEGYGDQNPIAPNTTAKGKAANRRVALTLKN